MSPPPPDFQPPLLPPLDQPPEDFQPPLLPPLDQPRLLDFHPPPPPPPDQPPPDEMMRILVPPPDQPPDQPPPPDDQPPPARALARAARRQRATWRKARCKQRMNNGHDDVIGLRAPRDTNTAPLLRLKRGSPSRSLTCVSPLRLIRGLSAGRVGGGAGRGEAR